MNQKYKELYELAKYALDEETQRSSRIDEKASRFLSVLSLLLGVVGLISNSYLSLFFPINFWADYLGIASFGIFAILLALSWYETFRVFKVSELYRVPMNDEMIQYFESNELENIYQSVAKFNFKECLENNRNLSNKKAERLNNSYRFIIATFFFALLCVLFSGIKIYNKDKNIKEEVVIMNNIEFIDVNGNRLKLIMERPPPNDPSPELPYPPKPPDNSYDKQYSAEKPQDNDETSTTIDQPPPNEIVTEGDEGDNSVQKEK